MCLLGKWYHKKDGNTNIDKDIQGYRNHSCTMPLGGSVTLFIYKHKRCRWHPTMHEI